MKPRKTARPHVPDHFWLIASGPYVSAHVRYSWTGVLLYADKRPGYHSFPAACIPAWLWTPFAALVCAVAYRAVSIWTRYFQALVLARWVMEQPRLPVLLARAGDVTLIEPRQMSLFEEVV